MLVMGGMWLSYVGGLSVRMAYIIYEDNSAMSAAFDKLIADPPSLEGKQLRIMKYDTTVEWPTGIDTA